LELYAKIFSQLKDITRVIIATDQNMDSIKIESHKNTGEWLNNMFASFFIPTLNKPILSHNPLLQ